MPKPVRAASPDRRAGRSDCRLEHRNTKTNVKACTSRVGGVHAVRHDAPARHCVKIRSRSLHPVSSTIHRSGRPARGACQQLRWASQESLLQPSSSPTMLSAPMVPAPSSCRRRASAGYDRRRARVAAAGTTADAHAPLPHASLPQHASRAQPSERRRLTAATASIDRHARKLSRGSQRRYGLPETSSELVGVVIDRCSVGCDPTVVAAYDTFSRRW